MLLGVTLGTNDLAKAGAFYDAVLGTINMVQTMAVEGGDRLRRDRWLKLLLGINAV
jgi:catechol 2,3-dioxygenase-like lactoylglutathione lyase family enzyme